jgi:thiol-disulfide isomerase/thioredoxin
MPPKKFKILCSLLIIATLLVLPLAATSDYITNKPYDTKVTPEKQEIKFKQNTLPASSTYKGHLRVYIVEPTSRWNDYSNKPYHFGFLDFAFNDKLSLPYGETYNTTLTWDANTEGYSGVTENNILVIAVLFNPEGKQSYAYPPIGNKFTAYPVDACAGAVPGSEGQNVVTDTFSHTVFVEEGTATWCPYCPAMAQALYSVYQSGEYPFYFVSMVGDKNSEAYNRLKDDYNFYGYPTSFFDGGFKVLVGGYDDEKYYQSRIESSGRRDVHDLDLTLFVKWEDDGQISINLSITNHEETENMPPDTPVIFGTMEGKIRTEYEYTFYSTDPDGDDIYYWVQWGEGCPSVEWIGPYESGEEVTLNNTWANQGDYIISVKAKDSNDAESDWGTLEIHMPKTKTIFSIPWILLGILQECFPFLYHLITHLAI